jgi:hypothetical protein
MSMRIHVGAFRKRRVNGAAMSMRFHVDMSPHRLSELEHAVSL